MDELLSKAFDDTWTESEQRAMEYLAEGPRTNFLDPRIPHHLPPGRLLCLAYTGSLAHGTYIPDRDPDSIDDVDYVGFYMPPKERILGLNPLDKESRHIQFEEVDIQIHTLRKIVELWMNGNPNVLCLLWQPDNLFVVKGAEITEFRLMRDAFVSQRIVSSHVGYAMSQYTKMTTGKFEGYMGERRKALVERYGYDTKNAAHLMRILTMGWEFIQTGNLEVDRTGIDAPYLMDIKKGKYTLSEIKEEADHLFELVGNSEWNFPDKPDYGRIEKKLVEIQCNLLRAEV